MTAPSATTRHRSYRPGPLLEVIGLYLSQTVFVLAPQNSVRLQVEVAQTTPQLANPRAYTTTKSDLKMEMRGLIPPKNSSWVAHPCALVKVCEPRSRYVTGMEPAGSV